MDYNWLEDFYIKRRSQRSCAYLFETKDVKRKEQLREVITCQEDGKQIHEVLQYPRDKPYDQFIGYDLQRQVLIDLKSQEPIQITAATGPLEELDRISVSHRTFALIYYVVTQAHADAIGDRVIAISQDSGAHMKKSTWAIITSDLGLFNSTSRMLCYPITIPASTAEEREKIIQAVKDHIESTYYKKYKTKLIIKVEDGVIQKSSGIDLFGVETVTMESYQTTHEIQCKLFTDYKIKMLQAENLEYVEPSIGFESAGGYRLVKEYIQKRITTPLKNPDLAKYYGVNIPKGIILVGPPGTGKSLFAEITSKEIGLPMIKFQSADYLGSYVGQTENRIRHITRRVDELSPVVFFIDEIDDMFPVRGTVMATDSGVQQRSESMWLSWLGDRHRSAFIIGTTNNIGMMDAAATRPGRFDDVILILYPDADARKEIFNVHTSIKRKIPLPKDFDFSDLVADTKLWTGAEIEKLCEDAARLAMDEQAKHVGIKYFKDAMSAFEVNEGARMQTMKQVIAQMKQRENVNKTFMAEALKDYAQHEPGSRLNALLEDLGPAGTAL